MTKDYQCGECWEWIHVNPDGTEDICRLTYPDGDIDYDEHECQGEIVAEPAEADPAEIKHA